MNTTLTACIGAVVLLRAISASTAGDIVGPALSVTKTEHLVAEPVSLTFTWTNRSKETIRFSSHIAREYSTIHVSVDRGEFREFTCPGGIVPRLVSSDVIVTHPMVSLAPGGTYSLTVFLLQARADDEEQFLLLRPGRYTLRAHKDDQQGVTIEARVPSSEQDKLAFPHWRDHASSQFPLLPEWIAPDLEPLENLIAKYPKSVYAQYARLALARHLVQHKAFRGKEESRKRAIAYADFLVRDRPNPPLVEHALWLQYSITDAREQRRRLIRELAQVNPRSGFLDILRQSVLGRLELPRTVPPWDSEEEEEKSSGPQEPKATSPVPLDLDRRSLAGLPPRAAALLETWQTAMARRDVEGALACLSQDFVANQGSKEDVRRHWEVSFRSAHERSILKQLGFRVERFHRAASYERPPNDDGWRPPDDQGKRARFQGDLLIVRARATTQTIASSILTDLTIVLKELDDDKWTIVSSHAKPVNSRPQEPDGAKEPK